MAPAEIDHVILLVPHLERAVRAFGRAGFDVRSGGRFPPGVPFHNALVVFENDLYIELLGVRRRAHRLLARVADRIGLWSNRFERRSLVERRIFSLVGQPPGFVDVCVRVAELDVRQLAKISGCPWEAVAMQRATASGATAAWELAFPKDPRLPFVICDRTPRSIRIPANVMHPNGVRRVERLDLLVSRPDEVALAYALLFGLNAQMPIMSQGVSLLIGGGRPNDRRAVVPELTLSAPHSRASALDDLVTQHPGLRCAG
ncbi:MAG TPA: VOC family protein [Verrucomicrobiae bacterium]|nr:VOC family protein [Verrucomicrobiae bacterium]